MTGNGVANIAVSLSFLAEVKIILEDWSIGFGLFDDTLFAVNFIKDKLCMGKHPLLKFRFTVVCNLDSGVKFVFVCCAGEWRLGVLNEAFPLRDCMMVSGHLSLNHLGSVLLTIVGDRIQSVPRLFAHPAPKEVGVVSNLKLCAVLSEKFKEFEIDRLVWRVLLVGQIKIIIGRLEAFLKACLIKVWIRIWFRN
jgi:hypothetical protein